MAKRDKTDRVLGTLRGKNTAKVNEMILPNHSGDHVRSIKRQVPVIDADIVNKKYVDDEIDTYTDDLRDDSMADALHRHSELSASDGTPNPALQVDADGNVGIGVAAPLHDLNVVGANWNGANNVRTGAQAGIEGATAAHGIYFRMRGGTNGISGNTYANQMVCYGGNTRMRIHTGGNVGIGITSAPGSHLTVGGTGTQGIAVQSTNAGQAQFIWQSGAEVWNSYMPAGTTALRFYKAGDKVTFLANGNVGIGTTAPEAILHTVANGAAGSEEKALILGNNDFTAGMVTRLDWQADSDNSSSLKRDSASIKVEQIDALRADMSFWVDELGIKQRMRILANGNVGIGTVTPTLPLDVNAKSGMSLLGGQCIKLTNKTGANSIQGEVVEADSTNDDSVVLASTNCLDPIGVFLEAGVADGAEAWIVIGGIADVLADNAGFTRGDRLVTSAAAATVARATTNNAPAVAVNFQEIGHAIETAAANVLGRVVLHFL